jgi:hypothetical protein
VVLIAEVEVVVMGLVVAGSETWISRCRVSDKDSSLDKGRGDVSILDLDISHDISAALPGYLYR